MPFWTYLYALLFWPLLAIAVLAALRWGGRAERQTSLVYAAACCLEVLVWSRASTRFSHVEIAVAAVDIGLFVALAAFTVRYGLGWLYMVAAIQLLMALSHFIKLIEPGLSRMAYTILSGAGGYPQVVLIIIGTVAHARAQRRKPQEHGGRR